MSDESSGAIESRRCKRVRMTVKLRPQGTPGDRCGCQKAVKAKGISSVLQNASSIIFGYDVLVGVQLA